MIVLGIVLIVRRIAATAAFHSGYHWSNFGGQNRILILGNWASSRWQSTVVLIYKGEGVLWRDML
jgi:hypothetical protein